MAHAEVVATSLLSIDQAMVERAATLTAYVVGITVTRFALVMGMQRVSQDNKAVEVRRINKQTAISEQQTKRESVWPVGIVLDGVLMLALAAVGLFSGFTFFNSWGIIVQFLVHTFVVELVYYWVHRLLHTKWVFQRWHQYHHLSVRTEPTTSLSFELSERLMYTLLFTIAPLSAVLCGVQSYFSLAFYVLWFDFMNAAGHSNFEFMPRWWMDNPLSFLLYTPSYHAVHHMRFRKNYALFMPWTDIVFGTCDWERTYSQFHKMPLSREFPNEPYGSLDFSLICHPSAISAYAHSKYGLPWDYWGNEAYVGSLGTYAGLFLTFPAYIYSSFFRSPNYHVEDQFEWSAKDRNGAPVTLRGETIVCWHPGIDYFMPSKYQQINRTLRVSMLDAQGRGARVLGLAALNKAEWLNHGGVDLLNQLGKQLDRSVVTHGDTMTAALCLKWIENLRERNLWNRKIFMIGATSKIGRACSLALARKGVIVNMFTQSRPRFDEIANELPVEIRDNLRFCTDLADGQECDLWVTGKFKPSGNTLLKAIPRGCTVVNFAVPDPLFFSRDALRKRTDIVHMDCGTLGYDPSMTSLRFTWLLPPGRIFACMAGCICHALACREGHEIGAVDMDYLEECWKMAQNAGFFLPSPTSLNEDVVLPERRVEEV